MSIINRIALLASGLVLLTLVLSGISFQNGSTAAGALTLAAAAAMGTPLFFALMSLKRGLGRMARELRENAEQLVGAARQSATASQALAEGATEQASSIEETSASVHEVNATTQNNAERSAKLIEVMNSAVPLVQRVQVSLSSLSETIQNVNAASEKIGSIVKLIDGIAFQTNILALNAAVEAARAGEMGLGFAVVADEVRNLAQRSATASKDTGSLVDDSVAMIRQSVEQLHNLVEATQANGRNAGEVKVLVDEVAAATQEQARGMEQIARVLPEIEKVTQRAAASAEQSAAAGKELTSQAQSLGTLAEDMEALAR